MNVYLFFNKFFFSYFLLLSAIFIKKKLKNVVLWSFSFLIPTEKITREKNNYRKISPEYLDS